MIMNRRYVLKSLAAVAGVVAVGVSDMEAPTTYGYLTVDGCIAQGLNPATARVFLDGVDVTHLSVQAAHDRRGYIDLFKRCADGRLYLDGPDGVLVKERRYGRVVVTFGASAGQREHA